MKFQDLPKDAQHHALSTLRELMVVGGENESGADIAAKVKTAFVSMYSDADTTTHTGTIDIKLGGIPAGTPSIDKGAAAKASYAAAVKGIADLVELLHHAKPGGAYSQAIALTIMACLTELVSVFQNDISS